MSVYCLQRGESVSYRDVEWERRERDGRKRTRILRTRWKRSRRRLRSSPYPTQANTCVVFFQNINVSQEASTERATRGRRKKNRSFILHNLGEEHETNTSMLSLNLALKFLTHRWTERDIPKRHSMWRLSQQGNGAGFLWFRMLHGEHRQSSNYRWVLRGYCKTLEIHTRARHAVLDEARIESEFRLTERWIGGSIGRLIFLDGLNVTGVGHDDGFGLNIIDTCTM